MLTTIVFLVAGDQSGMEFLRDLLEEIREEEVKKGGVFCKLENIIVVGFGFYFISFQVLSESATSREWRATIEEGG